MIKVDSKRVELNGPEFVLSAELGMLLRTIYKDEVISHSLFDRIVECAKMSDDDFEKEAKETRERVSEVMGSHIEFLDGLIDLLAKLGGGGRKEF